MTIYFFYGKIVIPIVKWRYMRMADITETKETVNSNNFTYSVKEDDWHVKKKNKYVESAIFIFLAGFLYGLGYHYFVATCKFAPGGIGGVVAMIQYASGSVTTPKEGIDYTTLLMLLLNVPLLAIASKTLDKDFIIKTFLTAVVLTVTMFLLSQVIDRDYKFTITLGKNPDEVDTGIRLVSAIIGGAFCGLSLACALKVNASTGGADILGAMLQKKNPHKSVASMILVVNATIMAVSIIIYKDNLMPVFLSLIYIFASTVTCDRIMQGAKSALKFEVITEHAEEISKEIIEELGHGVTITPAKGMFHHKDKNLLICIIRPRQISRFQDIIRKYPETFAYVGSVNEIIGKYNTGAKKHETKK